MRSLLWRGWLDNEDFTLTDSSVLIIISRADSVSEKARSSEEQNLSTCLSKPKMTDDSHSARVTARSPYKTLSYKILEDGISCGNVDR